MAASKKTILLVDDELSDLDMARKTLEELGYQVLTAADGQGALNLYRDFGHTVAFLVTDVAMSPMNGCELAVQLGAIQPDLKVLFVSGYAGAGVLGKERISELKAGFLRKPFTGEQLTKQVEALLAERGNGISQAGV